MSNRHPAAWAVFTLAGLALWGCATAPPSPALKDGELAVPADYKTWPKFLSAVQRPDAKQVREIYMNPTARNATAGSGFANGTVFVMENYAAKARADGTLETGPDGKLV
ncbi:MAG TPA: cytochrome P460 family protein, partial [Burkholderiaceae bacterium]|nr:cytochrome P460 family protein [Burkholderiaceae bacterium]